MSKIDLRNIHSLTDFNRNANAYVERIFSSIELDVLGSVKKSNGYYL